MKNALQNLGDTVGEFVVLWSEDLEEHFMVYNSTGKKGKLKRKCVLSNAFVNKTETNIGTIIKIRYLENDLSSLPISVVTFLTT